MTKDWLLTPFMSFCSKDWLYLKPAQTYALLHYGVRWLLAKRR